MHLLLLYKNYFMSRENVDEHLIASLKGLGIQGMTVEMTALIRSGALPVGIKLPSVRKLAEELGISPTSVSIVWNTLKKSGLVESAGRNGVWVCGDDPSPRPRRFESVGNFGNKTKIDLTYSGPDPALLPPLENALAYSCKTDNLHSYQREVITKELEQAVKYDWPYTAEAFVASNGGFDGLQAVLSSLIQPGTYVAVEEPTTARVLDILDNLGIRTVPVLFDEQGPVPDSLAQAMKKKLSGFLFQPRSHSVIGVSLSEQRMDELTSLLGDIPFIIEDDGIGPVSGSKAVSFGDRFPEKVVHIRSYSKTLGPDLRLAVISTTKQNAESIQAYRNFGASWTSRILQNAAAYLLQSDKYQDHINSVRNEYTKRRKWLTDALDQRGINYLGYEGFSLWIPVPSERFALVTLAVHGFAVFHGSRFLSVESPETDYIRIATSSLKEEFIDELADAIALCFDM